MRQTEEYGIKADKLWWRVWPSVMFTYPVIGESEVPFVLNYCSDYDVQRCAVTWKFLSQVYSHQGRPLVCGQWCCFSVFCFFSQLPGKCSFHPVQMTTVLSQPFFSTFVKIFHPRTELNCPCKYLTSLPAHIIFYRQSFFDIALAMQRKKFCVL